MWTLWCFNSACERHCGNEPLALGLPSEPSVASEAGIPVNTSQISFLFFFVLCFCRFSPNVGWVSTWPDRHRPSPSSVFLSSFFPSFLSLLCLGFSFLPPFLLNWVVWQAGLSDSAVYVGSLRGRGGTRHCAPRDGLVFQCYYCMSEQGPDLGGIKYLNYQEWSPWLFVSLLWSDYIKVTKYFSDF